MPCWLVDFARTIAWWLIGPIPILIVIVLMLWAPRVKRQWMKNLLRIVGGLTACFLVAIIGIGLLITSGDPKPKYQLVNSPNGKHRATLMYQAGFLGRDFSTVEITNANSCKRITAYVYKGPSELTTTEVTWRDDSHLEIKYRLDHEHYQHCETQAADVSITCIPVSPSER